MRLRNTLAALLLLPAVTLTTAAQKDSTVVDIWGPDIPNEIKRPNWKNWDYIGKDGTLRIKHNNKATLTFFRIPQPDAPLVIICPGGGYIHQATEREGCHVAHRLNELGYAAAVLSYRLPNDSIMTNRPFGPLQDAQRAVQYARENAKALGITPIMIGVMGFSAGGHLAASAANMFATVTHPGQDTALCRPDFAVLVYPVISLKKELTHAGTRKSLIEGRDDTPALEELLSQENRVTPRTPPTFIAHAQDDNAVPLKNTLLYMERLQQCGVLFEGHIFASGKHGFGITDNREWVQMMDAFVRGKVLPVLQNAK